jgi:hypothetical protein
MDHCNVHAKGNHLLSRGLLETIAVSLATQNVGSHETLNENRNRHTLNASLCMS